TTPALNLRISSKVRDGTPDVPWRFGDDEMRLLCDGVTPICFADTMVIQHLLGTQPAGSQGNGGALMRSKLLRLRPSHANDGGLGEIIEERQPVVCIVVIGSAVGHLDDQAAGILDQERQCEVARDDVRIDGEPQHAQPPFEGVLPHGHVPFDQKVRPPHIVDQDVQATLLTLDTRHQRLHLRRVQMIDLHGDAPAATCCTSSAVSSIVSGRLYSERCVRVVRPVRYTMAPAAPSSTAMPRPAPRVAPATNATLPSSMRVIIHLALGPLHLGLMPNYDYE